MIGVTEQDLASDSRAALDAAQRWARELGHGFVGTEHGVGHLASIASGQRGT